MVSHSRIQLKNNFRKVKLPSDTQAKDTTPNFSLEGITPTKIFGEARNPSTTRIANDTATAATIRIVSGRPINVDFEPALLRSFPANRNITVKTTPLVNKVTNHLSVIIILDLFVDDREKDSSTFVLLIEDTRISLLPYIPASHRKDRAPPLLIIHTPALSEIAIDPILDIRVEELRLKTRMHKAIPKRLDPKAISDGMHGILSLQATSFAPVMVSVTPFLPLILSHDAFMAELPKEETNFFNSFRFPNFFHFPDKITFAFEDITEGVPVPVLNSPCESSSSRRPVFITPPASSSGFANGSVDDDVKKIRTYELKRGPVSMKLTNWGASILSLILPDKNGKLGDVVLEYYSMKDYTTNTTNFGATVGRVANRIKGAQFTLNGTVYKLVVNSGGNNSIHGGARGFADVIWNVESYHKKGPNPSITFSYRSFDGEQGFPGDLISTVTYSLLEDQKLGITMKARALNKATPVNLINHAFWNLGGHDSGDILGEKVQIFGSQITVVDSQNVPTGEFASVKGTPYDFLKPNTVGSRINQLAKGYDINYVLDGEEKGKKKKNKKMMMKLAAIVQDEKSGRVMELFTNAPGVQFYTANSLKDVKGKGGFLYQAHAALCLETQAFPDSVNHPNFPSTIVTPENPYEHHMLFKFSTKAPPAFSQG
ncbi:Aldose 1-epimerase [Senna tora]|uniref:Aldose 1-epimerase n=1 Tax=Senna tora TaxID=362788 RepID=A0A834VZM5_9FABA|nr:Aldose 1-epimerase [Senna tora]